MAHQAAAALPAVQHALPGTEPPIWDVVWHPRDKGPGFSGGWRGFATDMVRRFIAQ